MTNFTERDLLVLLCGFISDKQIVVSDNESIHDMVRRYKNPPFTIAFPAAMRLTIRDTNRLNDLLKQAHALLSETEPVKG